MGLYISDATTFEIMPGLAIVVDLDMFDIQGGVRLSLDERWSNEVIIQFDASMKDVIEDNESKVQSVITVRRKHG